MTSERHPLRISYVSPSRSRDNDDFVLLEQEPWDPYIGMLTRFGVLAYLNSMLFETAEPAPYCGGDTFSIEIYAYPSRPDLNYLAGASWGELGERRVQEMSYTEAIQCNLELEPELTYPAIAVERYAWVGDAYSPQGDVLARPAVSIAGAGIRIAEPVYGTLLVTYRLVRHAYWLAIHPRPVKLSYSPFAEPPPENKLDSFVYACWDGGNTYIEVEPPQGAEEGECNYWSSAGMVDLIDDRRPPDHMDPEDEYVDIDYCTGLEIAE